MNERELYLNYHCPRWDELPKIELYMDQVVSILEESLAPFSLNEKTITPAMINNYVKQKIVKPPNKKKYDRVHLSYLYVVCILKRFMSLSQICAGIEFMLKSYPIPTIYDIFCEELEKCLHSLFLSGCEVREDKSDIPDEISLIKTVTRAFANLVYANYLISLVSDES